MDYYRVTVEIFSAGSPGPESRHDFIAEAAVEEIWRQAVRTSPGQSPDPAEREAAVTAAVEDATGDFLEDRRLLTRPLVGASNVWPATIGNEELPGRPPDLARSGVRLWYVGQRPAAR